MHLMKWAGAYMLLWWRPKCSMCNKLIRSCIKLRVKHPMFLWDVPLDMTMLKDLYRLFILLMKTRLHDVYVDDTDLEIDEYDYELALDQMHEIVTYLWWAGERTFLEQIFE